MHVRVAERAQVTRATGRRRMGRGNGAAPCTTQHPFLTNRLPCPLPTTSGEVNERAYDVRVRGGNASSARRP